MNLDSSKNLGGVGAILILVSAVGIFGIPYLSLIGLVGLILVLVALHSLGDYYKEKGIFNNAIYGVITAIVGAVITGVVAVIAVLASLNSLENFLVQIFPGWTRGDWASLSGMTPTIPSNIDFSPLATFIAALIVVFVVFIVFAVVATFLFRRSLKQLSTKSTVGLFSTAGTVLFIGAFLLILFIVPGLIVMWIAMLILAIAFFRLKPQEDQSPQMVMASPQPLTPV